MNAFLIGVALGLYVIGACMTAPHLARGWWKPSETRLYRQLPRQKRIIWDFAGVAVVVVPTVLWPVAITVGLGVIVYRELKRRYAE